MKCKKDVIKLLKVKLISYTNEPEKLVACAAKLCYSQVGAEEIRQNLTDEKVSNFVNMLAEIGHESPIEHVAFTFAIEGVSRSLLAQLTRHRIASYSVQSQRYVKANEFEFILPPEISGIDDAKKEFLRAMEEDVQHYESLTQILKKKHKENLINSGKEEKIADKMAEKKAIEDARYVLPNACETKLICTFNARSLLNFFEHRCCNRAQWEIRQLATEMLRLVSQIAPNIFKKSGPPCVNGACPEGKMSCGEQVRVKKYFSEIKGEMVCPKENLSL